MTTMRNTFLSLFAALSCAVGLTSCETYKEDFDIDYSPIFPISGEWLVKIHDVEADTLLYRAYYDKETKTWDTLYLFTVYTYNTADNSSDQMWIDFRNPGVANSDSTLIGRFRGKIACDVAAKTFSGTEAVNNYLESNNRFTVNDGQVELNAYTTPSGGVADKISFLLELEQRSWKKYRFLGFRETGWPEDVE